jgi:hypothetical protein
MGKIENNNFFDVPHSIAEWRDDEGKSHYPLSNFKNSSLKLYLALRHYANRYSKKVFYKNDKELHEVTGLSSRQLSRARNNLRETGFIKTFKRKDRAIDYEIIIAPKIDHKCDKYD